MKINIIISLIAILAIQKINATDGACAANPLLEKMEAFAAKLESGLREVDSDAAQATELTNALAAYREGDGDAAPSVGDLVNCSSFEGSNSCCTSTLVDTFPKVLKRFVKSKLKDKRKKPIQKIFIERFAKGVAKCISKEKAKELQESSELQAVLNKLKQCHRDKIKNQARIITGSLCALCFEPSDISTQFNENDQLEVSQTNYDSYDTALSGDFTCFNDLNSDIFSAIEDILAEFPDEGKCKNFKDKIQEMIDNDELNISPPNDCGQRASAFGEGCAADQDVDDNDFQGLDPSSKNVKDFKPPKPDGDREGGGKKGGGKNGGGESEKKNKKVRILTDDSQSDFAFVDTVGAYEVYASESEVGNEADLFESEDEAWGIDEDDLPDYEKDLTISGSADANYLSFGLLALIAFISLSLL